MGAAVGECVDDQFNCLRASRSCPLSDYQLAVKSPAKMIVFHSTAPARAIIKSRLRSMCAGADASGSERPLWVEPARSKSGIIVECPGRDADHAPVYRRQRSTADLAECSSIPWRFDAYWCLVGLDERSPLTHSISAASNYQLGYEG